MFWWIVTKEPVSNREFNKTNIKSIKVDKYLLNVRACLTPFLKMIFSFYVYLLLLKITVVFYLTTVNQS